MALSMTAMQRQMESEAAQLEKDIAAQLRTQYHRADHFREAAALYRDKIVPADEDAFRTSLSQYSSGKASLPDLLAYALAIYRDRTALTDFDLAYAVTLIDVERYTGNAEAYIALQKD